MGVLVEDATLSAPNVAGGDGYSTLSVAKVPGGAGSLLTKSVIFGTTDLPLLFTSICLMEH